MTHDEVRPLDGEAAESTYPIIGDNLEGLRDYLVRERKLPDNEAFVRVRDDAVAIIRNCVRFDAPDTTRTGLVVGYVQSGKTLSMTAVSALARDNGCRIVILLAGVTNILLEQSADRFRDDLRGASGLNTWRIFNSADGLGDTQLSVLQQAVLDWKDPVFKDDQQTLLFVVLKNHSHLDQLYWLLSNTTLSGVPCLVIDDEADQAGLNTSGEKDVENASTTYNRIHKVRSALPHHTYLQYTATPQAPLLIALDDMLSPAFAELVRPGDGYTGGQTFFGPGSVPHLVHSVPDEDQFKPGAPPPEVPRSLMDALRVFFVGCAVAAIRGKPNPRSMLVHPSQRTLDHKQYMHWITEATKRWITGLRSADEVDRQDVKKEFQPAYDELAKTDKELPPFADLVNRILIALTRVSLKEVNTQDGSEIDWKNASDHILVGGEKLNRGFTVEGLTVTYMPRAPGGWNADTIQQRARFFGYKSSYLTLCRLYLHPDVITAFRSYVLHEEDIRSQLAAHRGRPLREWRRAFFLDSDLQPTRRNVLLLADEYHKISKDKQWFAQRYPHEADEQRNRDLVDDFVRSLRFEPRDGFAHHKVARTSLKAIYEQVLIDYNLNSSDLPAWYAQLVTIGDIVTADPSAKVSVVRMTDESGEEARFRTDKSGIQIHQGASSKAGGYKGDKSIFDPDVVTVQVHRIILGKSDPKEKQIPALAIHIPLPLRRDDVGVQVASK